jgi:hypothetical protein
LRISRTSDKPHRAYFASSREMPAATVKAGTVAAYKSVAGKGGRISAAINLGYQDWAKKTPTPKVRLYRYISTHTLNCEVHQVRFIGRSPGSWFRSVPPPSHPD